MPNEVQRTISLLELLEEYLIVSDLWEDHNRSVIAKKFTLAQDKEAHAHIQRAYMIPLMDRCRQRGFVYKTLLEIIPASFKTDKVKRRSMLDSLYILAQEEHGYQPGLHIQ